MEKKKEETVRIISWNVNGIRSAYKWRLDYFFVSRDISSQVSGAYIMDDIMGSDST